VHAEFRADGEEWAVTSWLLLSVVGESETSSVVVSVQDCSVDLITVSIAHSVFFIYLNVAERKKRNLKQNETDVFVTRLVA